VSYFTLQGQAATLKYDDTRSADGCLLRAVFVQGTSLSDALRTLPPAAR
jgi:hypothetical protein